MDRTREGRCAVNSVDWLGIERRDIYQEAGVAVKVALDFDGRVFANVCVVGGR